MEYSVQTKPAEVRGTNGTRNPREVRAPEALSLSGALRAGIFHYGRILGNGNAVNHWLGRALEPGPEESVLDVGCGTGRFSQLVPGRYLGIDLDPDYIAFARRLYGSPARRFAVRQLETLEGEETFDRAMVVNCIHHLSDQECDSALACLSRIVRRRLVVVDADPESSNAFQAWLLAHDRGDFIRPVRAQRELIERHFQIRAEHRFPNTPHTLIQVLFVCEPKAT